MKKYIPLKKFMKENYLQEKKKAMEWRWPSWEEFKNHDPSGQSQGGFSIPFAKPAGGIVPLIPDAIDFGEWLIQQFNRPNGPNTEGPYAFPDTPDIGGFGPGEQHIEPIT